MAKGAGLKILFLVIRGFESLLPHLIRIITDSVSTDIISTMQLDLSPMSAKSDEFKVQLLETFASLITAAFGLVAALAWNDTIKAFIAQIFQNDDGLIGMFVYAIIVTVIAVVMTLLISRSLSKAKKALHLSKQEEAKE